MIKKKLRNSTIINHQIPIEESRRIVQERGGEGKGRGKNFNVPVEKWRVYISSKWEWIVVDFNHARK
jgi:hypothetical protein